jgi:dihydrofolate synthase / folylpolyglutamate synthase
MIDHAISDHPGVQAQLNRIPAIPIGREDLGLQPITMVLEELGRPDRKMPPVFHVAGTNGKGSTCAFLRAAIEAAGLSAHVHTSPHLVRPNERIRVAGRLISDDALEDALKRTIDASDAAGAKITFFEAMTAAAFLSFAETPADAAIIEVGLGGRLDATNVIEHPAVCGIAQLGVDHERFLGDDILGIAAEKAGIAKAGTPLVTMDYAPAITARIAAVAQAAGAAVQARKAGWDSGLYQGQLHYRDDAGKLSLPLPRLPGSHQAENAALAIAMIRHQSAVTIPESALRAAMGWAHWPGRLQRLDPGPLTMLAPSGAEVWLDGAHNEAAGATLAAFFKDKVAQGLAVHVIAGVLDNKDARGLLRHFDGVATRMTMVPVPGKGHHAPQMLVSVATELGIPATAAPDVATALKQSREPLILIAGSLYLAGDVLKANNQLPD